MNDFWETGIYIVITVGALVVAMIVILLLTATAKPKKSRRRVKGQAAGRQKAAASEPMLLAEGSTKEDKRGKNKKKGKPPKEEKQAKKSRQEKQEEEQRRKEEKQAAGQTDKKVATAAAGEEVEVPAGEDPKVAELPSVDTLDDSDDGSGEAAVGGEDLMSIFQVEEAEDSYVSDLANKLFDVETSNIQALGLEVLSVFSRGKPAEETKEDENE